MAEVALAFLWHQHQPYYPDDVAGENPMPWVRLHGVKDYYGMAAHLEEFPEMRCTINLVPSLLLQLQAYSERGASDRPAASTARTSHSPTISRLCRRTHRVRLAIALRSDIRSSLVRSLDIHCKLTL